MSKTYKMLYVSLFLSVLCGIILGLVRGNILFPSPYPAFYVTGLVVFISLGVAAFFVYISSKEDKRDNYTLLNIPSDWDTAYKKSVQVIQLIGAFLILMASVRIIVSPAFSPLIFINSIFSFACAISIFFRVKSKDIAENTALLSLFPVFYLCIYLLMFYRNTAKYPDLNLFGPQILTLAFVIVSAYLNAATKFRICNTFLRYWVTFSALSLCVGDFMAYVFNSQSLSISSPAIYLPTISGFCIFYTASLFIPPVQLLNIVPPKNDSNTKQSD